MTRLIILLFIIFSSLAPKAQDIECFILKAPEKPFYDIKKIGVLEFDCSSNHRMNKFVTDRSG